MKRLSTKISVIRPAATNAALCLLLAAPGAFAQGADPFGNAGRTLHSSLNQWADEWSPVGWFGAIGACFFGSRGRAVAMMMAAATFGLTHIDYIHNFIKSW